MKVWIVFPVDRISLDGVLLKPKVFTLERDATIYWEQINLKILAVHSEQRRKGGCFRHPEYLHITEQEI
jgi:hypothetical protein